jgi:hypothetical protein
MKRWLGVAGMLDDMKAKKDLEKRRADRKSRGPK